MYNRLYNFALRRVPRHRARWHHSVSRHSVSRYLAVFNIFLKSVILPPTTTFFILAKMCNSACHFVFRPVRRHHLAIWHHFFLFWTKCVTPCPILITTLQSCPLTPSLFLFLAKCVTPPLILPLRLGSIYVHRCPILPSNYAVPATLSPSTLCLRHLVSSFSPPSCAYHDEQSE